MPTRYLVTSALPYANGPIHFGHVAGAYLPADIFVRYRRLRGDSVLFICGTDEHGTPITVNAEKSGVSPQALVDRWHEIIHRSFTRLDILFDNFSQTTRPHHHALASRFFTDLLGNGFIFADTRPQQFCAQCKRGLPDRFVTGKCYRPECGYDQARGDECPRCGFNLEATKLIDPRCKTCGTPAEVRPSKHWYLDLPKLRPLLTGFLADKSARWKPNVLGEIKKFLDSLEPRAITRDLDWGVPVPLAEGKDKVLYVWFDAPIGYISSTIEWAQKKGDPDAWKPWWLDREGTRLVHFIGKDNISFHTVIWPSMLLGQSVPYVLPYDVPANEFYNLEARKFSTSEGWFIDIEQFLEKYPADTLRWTIARGAPESRDSDFAWKDFQAKVNAELLGNFGNMASRVLKFVREKYAGKVPAVQAALGAPEQEAFEKVRRAFAGVGTELDRYGVRAGAEQLLELGNAGNKLLEVREPWKAFKTAPATCATALNAAVRILETLAIGLSPFCPKTSERLWAQLGLPGKPADRGWTDVVADPAGRVLGALDHLTKKVEDAEVTAGVEALKAGASAALAKPAPAAAPAPAPIAYEDFAKLDIRIAKVISAVPVDGADKLLRLELEVEGTGPRTVLSGIRPWYTAEKLVGRQVVYLANLAPKKIRGVLSQGMILAAHGADGAAVLLRPEADVAPGAKVT